MSKSNHQKHGFIAVTGAQRREGWIQAKKLFREYKKRAIYNGRSIGSLFPGEVGRIEEVRFIETGGQV